MFPFISMRNVNCPSNQRKNEYEKITSSVSFLSDSNEWRIENDKILKLCKYSGRGIRIS